MNQFLRSVLLFISGESQYLTIEECYEAVRSEPLTVARMSPRTTRVEKHIISPMGGKARVTIFYKMTRRPDNVVVETIEVTAYKPGAVTATFVGEVLVGLTHNGVRSDVPRLNEQVRTRLWQILLLARAAAESFQEIPTTRS